MAAVITTTSTATIAGRGDEARVASVRCVGEVAGVASGARTQGNVQDCKGNLLHAAAHRRRSLSRSRTAGGHAARGVARRRRTSGGATAPCLLPAAAPSRVPWLLAPHLQLLSCRCPLLPGLGRARSPWTRPPPCPAGVLSSVMDSEKLRRPIGSLQASQLCPQRAPRVAPSSWPLHDPRAGNHCLSLPHFRPSLSQPSHQTRRWSELRARLGTSRLASPEGYALGFPSQSCSGCCGGCHRASSWAQPAGRRRAVRVHGGRRNGSVLAVRPVLGSHHWW